MTIQEVLTQALALEVERQRNFANPPQNCPHDRVYRKEGDNVHCHYCDTYLYEDRGDYDE